MARSLEGRKFFVTSNNGVTALIPEEVHLNREREWRIREKLKGGISNTGQDSLILAIQDGLRHIPGIPIFTFVDSERLAEQPWFTGRSSLLETLLEHIHNEGGEVEGCSFYVPFSNACELGVHGFDAMKSELKYVSTEGQFRETFVVERRKLERRRDDQLKAEIAASFRK